MSNHPLESAARELVITRRDHVRVVDWERAARRHECTARARELRRSSRARAVHECRRSCDLEIVPTRRLRAHVPAAHTFVIVTGCSAVRTLTNDWSYNTDFLSRSFAVGTLPYSEEGSDYIFYWKSTYRVYVARKKLPLSKWNHARCRVHDYILYWKSTYLIYVARKMFPYKNELMHAVECMITFCIENLRTWFT